MIADRPPESIPVGDAGIVLRRHRVDDADAIHSVIEENRDHLRPFMPWADQPREETVEFLSRAMAEWDSGTNFNFLITVPASGSAPEEILGGIGLHHRSADDSLEIGYWLRRSATGRGVITTAARCLTDIALAMNGIETVEIHCDEANLASAAVPRRLGFAFERLEARPLTAPGAHGRHMVWVCRAAERPGRGS